MKNRIMIILLGCFINNLQAQVAPLMNTAWNQGCYYNADCPSNVSGACGRTYTGCGATAMAQIMKYYAHPAAAWEGIYSYTPDGYPMQTVNYSTAVYNWAAMPNSLSSSNAEVAKVMHHAGVSVDMSYGIAESTSSFDISSFKKFFKYSLSIRGAMKASYSNTAWENLLKNELDNGRVVFVKSPTHFYVIDGYQTTPSLKFHCNFGWGGSYNGFYNIHSVIVSSINFTPSNAIIGIKPLLNVELSPDTLEVSANATTFQYEFSSLSAWNISSNQAWCTPALSSGTSGYFNFLNGATGTVTPNLTYAPRYATLTISDGSNTDVMVIKQSGITPYLSLSPNNLTYISTGGSQNVTVSSDSGWVATSSDPWLSITPSSGSGNTVVSISASPNGPSSRTGNVVISRGALQQSVSIFQAASGSFWCTPSMTVSGSNGITNVSMNTINRASTNNEEYVNTGASTTLKNDSTYTVSVTFIGSNAPAIWIDWNIDGDFSDAGEAVMPPAGSWYPSFAGTKNLNVTVPSSAAEGLTRMRVYAKNFGTGPVSGPCNISDAGGDIEDYTINLIKHKHITVTPNSLAYVNSGGMQSVAVDCDSVWSANTGLTWLALTPNSGSGNGTIDITASANTSLSPRSGVVNFVRGGITKVVSISQAAADSVLNVSLSSLNFTNIGGILSFDVSANISYSVSSSQSWISTDVNAGEGNLTIAVNVSNNSTAGSRNGTITVSRGTFVKTINVTQDPASVTLSVSTDTLKFTYNGTMQNFTINTPDAWTATKSDGWFTINQNSGTGTFSMGVTPDNNATANSRNGSITITNGLVTKVVIIHQYSASVTSTYKEVFSENKWEIFPNPASSFVTIKSKNINNSTREVFVCDVYGKAIGTMEVVDNKINVSELEAGIYFLFIQDIAGSNFYFKLVKE